jgi:hypothetical protein
MLGQSLLSLCGPFDKGYVTAVPLFIPALKDIDTEAGSVIIYSGLNILPGLTLRANVI